MVIFYYLTPSVPSSGLERLVIFSFVKVRFPKGK